MTDGSVLYAFRNIYEPIQEGDMWVVNYKWENEWKKQVCKSREEAFRAYRKREKELMAYYKQFLRELKVRK